MTGPVALCSVSATFPAMKYSILRVPSVFRGWLAAAAVVALYLGVSAAAHAQVQEPRGVVRVTLLSGDVLTGTLIERANNQLVLEHPVFGQIAVPLESIREIGPATPLTPEEAAAAAGEAPPDEAPVEEVLPENPWDLRFELGAAGSRGNSRRDTLRTAFLARRETELLITDLSANYRFGRESGATTENRFFALGRQQWRVPDSRWSYFVEGSVELDEFKDFDARIAASAGLGYRVIDREDESLTIRGGLGASQSIGAPDDDIRPEAIAALDYLKQLNKRTRFTFFAEYVQDLEDTDFYRARGEAALDISLSEDNAWLLKLSVENRYDSNPGDADRNNFFYGASLVLVF